MLLPAHSGIRYLILLAAILSLGYGLYGLATKRAYDRAMKKIGSAFAGLLHLQVLLGLAVLFSGRFQPAVFGHVVMMVFAAVIAQLPVSVMRRRPWEDRTYAPHVVATLVVAALIWAGVAAISRPLIG